MYKNIEAYRNIPFCFIYKAERKNFTVYIRQQSHVPEAVTVQRCDLLWHGKAQGKVILKSNGPPLNYSSSEYSSLPNCNLMLSCELFPTFRRAFAPSKCRKPLTTVRGISFQNTGILIKVVVTVWTHPFFLLLLIVKCFLNTGANFIGLITELVQVCVYRDRSLN
jgi:hypothetical protein